MADVTYPSSTDGDAIVKQYSSITIDAGDTVTVQNRCKGLILYCQGDCTINGTLTMTAKGGGTGAPVGPVPSNGLRWAWRKNGASDGPFTSGDFPLGALGSAASAITNPAAFGEPAAVAVVSAKTGGAGSTNVTGGDRPWPNVSNRAGGTATNGTGGGGAGVGYNHGGNGGTGNCWGGGGGGGGAGAGGSGQPGNNAQNGTGGGSGGAGPEGGRVGGGGGAGAPPGAGASDADGNGNPGGAGVGGLLCLFVGGNLTVGPSGVISSNGTQGGHAAPPGGGGNCGGGGGSGGGRIIIVHAGTYTNNGTVAASGGLGGGGGPNPTGATGNDLSGSGGAGAVTSVQVDAAP